MVTDYSIFHLIIVELFSNNYQSTFNKRWTEKYQAGVKRFSFQKVKSLPLTLYVILSKSPFPSSVLPAE